MQILGLLGMNFDAAVVFVSNSSHLFRFVLDILCKTDVTKMLKEGHSFLSRNKVLEFQVPLYNINEITTQGKRLLIILSLFQNQKKIPFPSQDQL